MVLRIIMYVVRPNFEKNNNMTRGSQGFVGQSSPNLAHV